MFVDSPSPLVHLSRMRSSLARWFVPLFCLALLVPAVASARITDATTGLTVSGQGAGLATACGSGGATACIATMVGRILNVIFGFIGIVLLGYIVYGGFSWMTAGGLKEVEQAKGVIRNAVIGVAIIACSFALSSFALDQLGQIATGAISGGSGSGSGTGNDATLNALMDGATRQCCYNDATPMISCTTDCQRTPTAFGLTSGADENACITACGSRLCPTTGPVPGQAQCTPGAPSGGSVPSTAFSLPNYCTTLGREAAGTTCDACVHDCMVRSVCTPGDPIYIGGRILSTTDATNQRGNCRETVCTMGSSPACTR